MIIGKFPKFTVSLAVVLWAVVQVTSAELECLCPDEFTIQGNRMCLFSRERTWQGAIDQCESMGMRLLTIPNRAKMNRVRDYLFTRIWKETQQENLPGIHWHLWLAASDITKEGDWTWRTTGQKVTYASWKRNEPNGARKENCMELRYADKHDVHWNDAICGHRRKFICETIFDEDHGQQQQSRQNQNQNYHNQNRQNQQINNQNQQSQHEFGIEQQSQSTQYEQQSQQINYEPFDPLPVKV